MQKLTREKRKKSLLAKKKSFIGLAKVYLNDVENH